MISVRQKAMDAYLLLTRKLSGRGLRLGRWKGLLGFHNKVLETLPPPGLARVRVEGFKVWVVPRDLGLGDPLIRYGKFEEFEISILKDALKPGMSVLDLGANIGVYSLIAAQSVGPTGSVYSFEPEPQNFQLLVRNLGENGLSNVTPLQKAVSSRNGTITLYFDDINFSCASLGKPNVTRDSGGVEVEAITLDSFVQQNSVRVDFIKIDIQGAEGLFLQGAKSVLSSQNPQILMEYWPFGLENLGSDPKEVWRSFEELGYEISVINELEGRIEKLGVSEALARCSERAFGRGHINLLLRKLA